MCNDCIRGILQKDMLNCELPGSGSAFKLVVTKLDGKSPVPLWFSPFHQFGSLLDNNMKDVLY